MECFTWLVYVKFHVWFWFTSSLRWSVEDPAHSDFLLLRNMLVRTHMQDLKDVTQETHYENYRAECIQNMRRMNLRKHRWVEAGCGLIDKLNTPNLLQSRRGGCSHFFFLLEF